MSISRYNIEVMKILGTLLLLGVVIFTPYTAQAQVLDADQILDGDYTGIVKAVGQFTPLVTALVDLATDITGTLPITNGGTGATTLNNLITLGTHTVGDYVATITGSATITSSGATTGEGTAHILSVTADSIGDTQLAFNTGQTLTSAASPTFAGLTITGEDGCAEFAVGVLGSTGSPCGSGGGGIANIGPVGQFANGPDVIIATSTSNTNGFAGLTVTGSGDTLTFAPNLSVIGDVDFGGFKLTNLADPTNAQDAATMQYVIDSVTGLLDYRGGYDASTNLFPATGGSGLLGAVLKGDFWIVTTPGTLGGTAVTNGDLVIAIVDTPGQTASNWDIIANDLGYAPLQSVVGTANRITVDNTDPINPVVDISGSYVGQSSITTLGTIGTGVWNGTTIAVVNGGTGATAFTNNRLLTGNGTGALVDEANLTFDGSLLAVTGNASTTQLTTTGSTYLATAGGRVGIGTTSPSARLSIDGTGTGTGILLGTSGSGFNQIYNAGGALQIQTGANSIIFAPNGAEGARFSSVCNYGV